MGNLYDSDNTRHPNVSNPTSLAGTSAFLSFRPQRGSLFKELSACSNVEVGGDPNNWSSEEPDMASAICRLCWSQVLI